MRCSCSGVKPSGTTPARAGRGTGGSGHRLLVRSSANAAAERGAEKASDWAVDSKADRGSRGRVVSETSLAETKNVTGHHDVRVSYTGPDEAEILAGVYEVALGGLVEDVCHSGDWPPGPFAINGSAWSDGHAGLRDAVKEVPRDALQLDGVRVEQELSAAYYHEASEEVHPGGPDMPIIGPCLCAS